MLPPFLQKWIFLNVLRLLTITSATLVIASTIRILQHNFANFSSSHSASSASTGRDSAPLDYYASTDIPTQTWGVLWSTVHHVFNLLCLLLVVLSEISWGGWLDRFFEAFLPFLGPEWGTEMMGALLILLGADSLSRRIATFPLIANWLLVSVGLINLLSGIAFHSRAKLLRSPRGFKRPVAEKLEKLAEARAKAEKVKDLLLPLPATAPSNDSNETMVSHRAAAVGAAADKLKGLWAGVQERVQHSGRTDPANVAGAMQRAAGADLAVPQPQPQPQPRLPNRGREGIPAAVPFRPGMPPPPTLPPPAAFAPASGPGAPPAASTLSAQSGHLRSRSPDFTMVNARRPDSLGTCSTGSHPDVAPSAARRGPTVHAGGSAAEAIETSETHYLTLPLTSNSTTAPLTVGEERSPGVLAKFQAAELEAKIKAKSRAEKKSLYLGSRQWLETRGGAGSRAESRTGGYDSASGASEATSGRTRAASERALGRPEWGGSKDTILPPYTNDERGAHMPAREKETGYRQAERRRQSRQARRGEASRTTGRDRRHRVGSASSASMVAATPSLDASGFPHGAQVKGKRKQGYRIETDTEGYGDSDDADSFYTDTEPELAPHRDRSGSRAARRDLVPHAYRSDGEEEEEEEEEEYIATPSPYSSLARLQAQQRQREQNRGPRRVGSRHYYDSDASQYESDAVRSDSDVHLGAKRQAEGTARRRYASGNRSDSEARLPSVRRHSRQARKPTRAKLDRSYDFL